MCRMSQSSCGMAVVNRDFVLRPKLKVVECVTKPYHVIVIDLAKQEEDEAEERSVRLAFLRKMISPQEHENGDQVE